MEKSMDESLDNSQKSFENLKNESDDLDIVLQEFGYHYEENDGENDESENHLRYCIIIYVLINISIIE